MASVNFVMGVFKRRVQTELKAAAAADRRRCFSKSPHQLVVIGCELAQKWTMDEDDGLSLVTSHDIAVRPIH